MKDLKVTYLEYIVQKEAIDKMNKDLEKARECKSNNEDILEQYVLDNKLYGKLEELEKYEGEDIKEITLVVENEKGELELEYLYCGDIFQVENGKLEYSDYETGIMSWDKDKGLYVYHYHGSMTEMNVVGFLDLQLGSYFTPYTKPYKHYSVEEIVKEAIGE